MFPLAGPLDFVAICDYVCVYRFGGFVPVPEIEPWLQQGLALLSDAEPADFEAT